MKDKALWTIVIVIAVLALLDWLGVSGRDILNSARRVGGGGDNRLLGWAVLGLVAYTVYRIINHITKP
jgi:hypothetical protein